MSTYFTDTANLKAKYNNGKLQAAEFDEQIQNS